MSSSPKYSSVSIDEEYEREIRVQRERERAAERARLAAERRRREEERRKQTAADLSSALKSQFQRVGNASLSPFVDREALRALHLNFQNFEGRIAAIDSDRALKEMQRSAETLREQLSQLYLGAQQMKLRRELGELEASQKDLEQRLGAIDFQLSVKFDRTGRERVMEELEKAKKHLQLRQPDTAKATLQEAGSLLKNHNETVSREHQAWTHMWNSGQSLLETTRDQVEGMALLPTLLQWCPGAIKDARNALRSMEAALSQEQFEELQPMADLLSTNLNLAMADAERLEDLESRRRFIVHGVMEALRQTGLASGGPQYAQENNPRADVLLHAVRSDGSTLDLRVPQEGDMQYEAHGFSRHEFTNQIGNLTRTCDGEEEFIEGFKSTLHDLSGVVTGPLQWDGKDPDRIAVERKTLPTSASSDAERRRFH